MTWDVYGDQLQWEMKDLDLASDFETAWKAATEAQKLWFLIRFEEIKKISKRADILRRIRNESRLGADDASKKDLFAYRFWALTLFVTFISTLIFVENIRYLIISISICYVGFRSFPVFFPDQLGDFYDKDRNILQSKNMLELREIEIFLHENTPLDDVYNYIVFGEPTLSNYVKTSLRFRKHLLEDCKEAFNFKPES